MSAVVITLVSERVQLREGGYEHFLAVLDAPLDPRGEPKMRIITNDDTSTFLLADARNGPVAMAREAQRMAFYRRDEWLEPLLTKGAVRA